jgi:4-amino-4-deoxychorismate lyase
MILVNGAVTDCIPADDRGFAYGDGVFRTAAMRDGRIVLWDRHFAKLSADCKALDIPPPEQTVLQQDLQSISAVMPDCAVRITVTRGSGSRGYAPPCPAVARRVVAASPLPDYPREYASQGVGVRFCDQRLAPQGRLAGIKHLNRLENVLARAEWGDPAIAEGLLCDTDGTVIEGTRSNLILVEGGMLVTPDLSRCGVAGVTRDTVIALSASWGMNCSVDTVSRERLQAADEVMLINSLIGVWPVARLAGRHWTGFPVTGRVRQCLGALCNAAP